MFLNGRLSGRQDSKTGILLAPGSQRAHEGGRGRWRTLRRSRDSSRAALLWVYCCSRASFVRGDLCASSTTQLVPSLLFPPLPAFTGPRRGSSLWPLRCRTVETRAPVAPRLARTAMERATEATDTTMIMITERMQAGRSGPCTLRWTSLARASSTPRTPQPLWPPSFDRTMRGATRPCRWSRLTQMSSCSFACPL